MKIPAINVKSLIKLWPIFLIIIMATLAVWMAYKYLDTRTAEVEERLSDKAAKTRIVVVVPIRDLNLGEELDISTLATREVPREYVNADALTQDTVSAYAGKKIIRKVSKGTPLLASFVAAYEFKPFSTSLEAGTRAITLPVDEINSVSGMLTVGDKVDILLLMQIPSPRGAERSEMQLIPLLEGITIRATGTTTQRELLAQTEAGGPRSPNRAGGAYTTITIAVLPRDAQKIVLAQQAGRIIALLRRPDDAALYGERLTSSEVFGFEPPAVPKLGPTISYIVGGSFSTGSQGMQALTGNNPLAAAGGNSEMLKRLMQSVGGSGGMGQ